MFIELTKTENVGNQKMTEKVIVNTDTIRRIYKVRTGKANVIFRNGFWIVRESYKELKAILIQQGESKWKKIAYILSSEMQAAN